MVLKEIWLTKVFCGLLGSVVGIICYPAKTAKEAASRVIAGGLSAGIATGPTMRWLEWQVTIEGELNFDGILAVAGLWGFCGWFVLGAFAKSLDQIKTSQSPVNTLIYFVRNWKAPANDSYDHNQDSYLPPVVPVDPGTGEESKPIPTLLETPPDQMRT